MNQKVYVKIMILEKMITDDYEYYLKFVTNEEIMKLNYGRCFTDDEAKMLFDIITEINSKNDNYGYFKAYSTVEKKYIGLGAIYEGDDNNYEIEYMILPEMWKKGYGTELMNILMEKTTENIIAYVDPFNTVSIKMLDKEGFEKQETITNEDGEKVEVFLRNKSVQCNG